MQLLNRSTWLCRSIGVAGAFAIASAGSAAIIHVDDDAPPGGDGQGWGTAFRFLQDALAVAEPGDEVWVAEGTYLPDRSEANVGGTGDVQATFQLLNDVSLLGGYAGIGAMDPDVRDIVQHETILSGDLLGNDEREPDWINYEENSWHVVTGSGVGPTTFIEGFTITAGYADGPFFPAGFDASGGGMITEGGSPTVQTCTFQWNRAKDVGAGMANLVGSSPIVTDCTFGHNWVEADSPQAGGGGGMMNFESGPQVSECTFTNNTADFGGGMWNFVVDELEVANSTFEDNTARVGTGGGLGVSDGSQIVIRACMFDGNTAGFVSPSWAGGGLLIASSNGVRVLACTFQYNQSGWGAGFACFSNISDAAVISCKFVGNIAAGSGGGMGVEDAEPLIVNCLFTDNESAVFGGGLHTWTDGHPTLINTTFIGNTAPTGAGVYNHEFHAVTMRNSIVWDNVGAEIAGPLALVDYSDVQGGYAGSGNIDLDPNCRDLAGRDLRLASGSPCIDAGDNTALPADELDLDGDGDMAEPIPLDLAALPRFVDDPETIDTGNPDGIHSLVDMGAYEFCRADAVADGVIDVSDLVAIITAWGGEDPDADTNADGVVDVQDLLAVIVNWGPCM